MAFEKTHALFHFLFDGDTSFVDFLLRDDVVGCGKYCYMLQLVFDLPGQDINFGNPFYLVPEKFYPICRFAEVCREDLKHVPAHAEGAAVEVHVVAGVLDAD